MNFKSEKLHDTICFALMRFTEKTMNIIWFAPSLNKRVSLHYANKNPPEITISCRASTFIFHFAGRLAHTAIFISAHRRIIGLIL